MPGTEIAAGLGAAKSLMGLLRGMKDVTDQAERSQIIIQAQEQILALQESIFTAQQALDNATQEQSELRAKIVEYEDWSEQEANYELDTFRTGIMAYHFVGSPTNSNTPSHWVCPTCFANRETHILQQPIPDDPLIECPKCKWHFDIAERESNCVG